MRRHTPFALSSILLLLDVPSINPLAIGYGPGVVRKHGHFYVPKAALPKPMGEAPSRKNMMMANPSTPVPRNIKDTVSCLRAAVQVRMLNVCGLLMLRLMSETHWLCYLPAKQGPRIADSLLLYQPVSLYTSLATNSRGTTELCSRDGTKDR